MQAERLFHRALGEHAAAAGLAADQNGQRVEGRVAGHAHGGLDLGEAAQHGLGRIGGQQGRVLALVGDVGLVGGRAPDAHLGHAHHHLEHVHVLDDIHQLGRGAAAGEALDCGLGGADVHQPARDVERGGGHDGLGHGQVDAMVGDKEIEHVKVGAGTAVELHHPSGVQAQAGRRVSRAVGHDQAGFGPGLDKGFLVDVALFEALKTVGGGHAIAGYQGRG